MNVVTLLLGWLAVWCLGIVVVWALTARRGQERTSGTLAWDVGRGWFVGAFLLTLWMRALSVAHLPFGIATIGLPVAAAAGLLGFRLWRAGLIERNWRVTGLLADDLAGWRRAVWLTLLAWLAIRFAMLLTEIIWRPLFPWDAWTQWATKARVWFELRGIAPFVTASEWLQANAPGFYFDAAPHYPATVPLLQVWSATLLGEWNDSLVNLPWWLTGLAFAFAIYGYLAHEGFDPLLALVGTWLVLSLPILDAHIALAGYADLAMSSYLTLAALGSLYWVRTRHWGDGVIALVLLAACVLIKNPGKIWVLTLVPGVVAAFSPRLGLRVAATCFAVAAGLVLILARTQPVVLGYHFHLDFDMPWNALLETYLAMGNWHLLWYGAVATALLSRRQLLSLDIAPYTLIVGAGMMFLFFGFAFTNAKTWVEDQSTVNRATLHLAPLVIIWMLFAFRAWARQMTMRSSLLPDHASGAG